MAQIKTKIPTTKPTQKKSTVQNLALGEKLQERALKYSDFSGLKITALLRSGLDELLKKNNF